MYVLHSGPSVLQPLTLVIRNYTVVCEALANINSTTHDEYGRKAGGLLAQMEKFSIFFGLQLSHLIFFGAGQLSITLQGKDTTVQESINTVDLAVKFLERIALLMSSTRNLLTLLKI